MFRPYLPRGRAKIGHGGPHLKKLFLGQKATATNRMHSNDLEACGMKLCCFWFHSDVKFLTRSLYSGERQWPTWASCFFSLRPMSIVSNQFCPAPTCAQHVFSTLFSCLSIDSSLYHVIFSHVTIFSVFFVRSKVELCDPQCEF